MAFTADDNNVVSEQIFGQVVGLRGNGLPKADAPRAVGRAAPDGDGALVAFAVSQIMLGSDVMGVMRLRTFHNKCCIGL